MLCNIDMPMDKYHTTDSKFITCWFLNPMLVPIIKSRAYKISFQRLSSRPLTLVFKGYPKTTTGSGRIWRRFHDFWCFFFGLPLLTISPPFHSIVKKKTTPFHHSLMAKHRSKTHILDHFETTIDNHLKYLNYLVTSSLNRFQDRYCKYCHVWLVKLWNTHFLNPYFSQLLRNHVESTIIRWVFASELQ
jgi:hypothetical protein